MKKIICVSAVIGIAIIGMTLIIRKKKTAEKPIEGTTEDFDDFSDLEEYVKNDEVSVGEFVERLKDAGYLVGEAAKTAMESVAEIETGNVASRMGLGRPYVINEKEFDEGTEDRNGDPYDRITFLYFADGIISDNTYTPVTNTDDILGGNVRAYFSSGADTVWIRNDERRCDYEILRDLRTFAEVNARRPHIRWVNDERLE